ncbi:MAG TPA: GNAT family N-acetyltransferase [Actinoplanes sp.]|nr:GNAT family N-acetyltransferase [Actinoplanes sp.]
MGWHTTTSAEEFLAGAGEFLRSRPVENTILLTVATAVRDRGSDDPLFGWFTRGGRVDGAFLHTPPYPLVVSAVPPGSLPALAETLADRPLPEFNARPADADEFAAAWRARTGQRTKGCMRTRLFRLDELTPPAPPPGRPRVAGPDDRALLIDWFDAFQADIGANHRGVEDLVDHELSYGGLTLWEVHGTPVAMAGVTVPAAGMVRVIAVYTPLEMRGHGYGGAVTAAVSQAALDAGAEDVVLFTDLANPTSNALYQRLGYRPVEDRHVMEFSL